MSETGTSDHQIPADEPADTEPISQRPYSRRRVRFGLTVTILGYLIFLLGARPGLFGLDRSPVIGFVQIAVFLIGLALMCIGGYSSLMALWKGYTPSIGADIGLRMVATGYLVAVFTGMADVFGLGSHSLPDIPFFGVWQARGVVMGETIIAIGLLLCVPMFRIRRTNGKVIPRIEDSNGESSAL